MQLAALKNMEQISIENVLVKLNDTVDSETSTVKTYGIQFINAKGETREITCRKATKMPKAEVVGADQRGNHFYNLKQNGILLLEDIDAGHPRSIKAAMIYRFRNHKSSTWHNVYH